MHVHESRDKPFDFDDGGTTQLNTNNNTSTSRDTHKDQDGVSGQLHSECREVNDSSAELEHMPHHDNVTKSSHGVSVLNKSIHKEENLDLSTESGSWDST